MIQSDHIQENLQGHLERFAQAFPQSTVSALHLLYGGLQTPGSTRHAVVKFSPRQGAADAMRSAEKRKNLENGAFQSYVHSIERSNLLLSFAEILATREQKDILLCLNYSSARRRVWCWRRSKKDSMVLHSLSLSRPYIDSLCPDGIASKFLDALLKDADSLVGGIKVSQGSLAEPLQYYRYRTLVLLESVLKAGGRDRPWASLLPAPLADGESSDRTARELTLSFLWGLQGSLLFQIASSGKEQLFGKSAMLGALQVDQLGLENGHQEPIRSFPMISPVRPAEARNERALRVLFAELIRTPPPEAAGPDRKARAEEALLPSSLTTALGREVEAQFPIRKQADRAAVLAEYLAQLLLELQNSKHEGEALDFWFVVGNISEFSDSSDIDVLLFNEIRGELGEDGWKDAFAGLGVPWSDPWPACHIAEGARTLVGEHFPWFQGGRYGLFYDVSGMAQNQDRDEPYYPAGLVRLRGGSWESYERLAFSKDSGTQLPANLVVFQRGSEGFGGILTSRTDKQGEAGDKKGPGKRVVLLARTQAGRLETTGEGPRREALEKFLDECGLEEAETRNDIASMVIRVAENPARGGTLVLAGDELADFLSLGRPWNFSKIASDPWDDIEALVSHDGATVIHLMDGGKKVKWIFRRLLSADAIDPKEREAVMRMLEKAASPEPAEAVASPLRGAGSRRWSAALTAFCRGVRGVIVVSQDGDISLWRRMDSAKGQIGARVVVLKLGQDRPIAQTVYPQEGR